MPPCPAGRATPPPCSPRSQTAQSKDGHHLSSDSTHPVLAARPTHQPAGSIVVPSRGSPPAPRAADTARQGESKARQGKQKTTKQATPLEAQDPHRGVSNQERTRCSVSRAAVAHHQSPPQAGLRERPIPGSSLRGITGPERLTASLPAKTVRTATTDELVASPPPAKPPRGPPPESSTGPRLFC